MNYLLCAIAYLATVAVIIYMFSKLSRTCPTCGGTGSRFNINVCPDCNGEGKL